MLNAERDAVSTGNAAVQARYGELLAIGEFRTLLIGQTQSRFGDQLARVALALLVYSQTASAVLTALVYALTLLPPLLTAPVLAGLADRYSRRTVMVVTDLLRGILVAIMAAPASPLVLVVALVVAMACLQPMFAAARNATLPAVLDGDRFQLGMGVIKMADSMAQILGFSVGGVVVVLLGGPHVALALDAATFMISAALVRFGIQPHRPPAEPHSTRRGFAWAGVHVLRRDRRIGGIALLVWLFGFYLAPEALAAPYAHQIEAGTITVGILMAAAPVGVLAGSFIVTRLVPPERRGRLTVPLAFCAGIPLLINVIPLPVALAFSAWASSGAFASYLVLAQVQFARAVPDALRARAIGVASAGFDTAQGIGVLLAGAIAQALTPSLAIAICAAGGMVAVTLVHVTCQPSAAPQASK